MRKIANCILAIFLITSLFGVNFNVYADDLHLEKAKGVKYYTNNELNEMFEDIAENIAVSKENEGTNKILIKHQEEDTYRQLSEGFSNKVNARVPTYDYYRTDSPTIVYTSAQGYADGQPTGGYTMKTGDMLYWDSSGGKVVYVNVSFGYKDFTFSVGLGFGGAGSVGSGFRVPSNGNYKIYVIKDYKVSNPNVYGHPYNSPEGTWERIELPPTQTYTGDRTHLKKV